AERKRPLPNGTMHAQQPKTRVPGRGGDQDQNKDAETDKRRASSADGKPALPMTHEKASRDAKNLSDRGRREISTSPMPMPMRHLREDSSGTIRNGARYAGNVGGSFGAIFDASQDTMPRGGRDV